MFSPLVLLCSMVTFECATYGGPVFKTEIGCYIGMQQVGIPFLEEKYPNLVVTEKRCIYWGKYKTEVDT